MELPKASQETGLPSFCQERFNAIALHWTRLHVDRKRLLL
jgi:hypothetical protein